MSRRTYAALLAVTVSVYATNAAAEPAPGVAPSTRARVRVRLVGALARDATLRDRIQSWFDPSEYDVTLQGASYLDPNQVLSPESGLLVEAWVAERSSKRLRLYFASVDPTTRKTRYLLRDLSLEAGLDEVGAEELAQAVHLSASALVEGEIASSREQIEASLRESPGEAAASAGDAAGKLAKGAQDTPPAPTAASATRPPEEAHDGGVVLHGAVGYAASLRGDEGLAHGPHLRASLGSTSGWGGSLRASGVVPHRVTRSELDLELYGAAALLALTFRTPLSSAVSLEGFAGPSLELVHYRASAHAGSTFEPASAATELRPELTLGVMIGFGRYPRVALVPELSLSLQDTHYDMARGGRTETVARASRVTAKLGLELEL